MSNLSADTEASLANPGVNIAYVIYTIGEVLIGTASAIGNAMVLIAIVKEKQLQTVTNYFVASLAGADFLVGVLGIPCTIIAFNGKPNSFSGCLMMNSIIVILTQISIFGLLAIALERFVAIKYPFKYTEKCTRRISLPIVTSVWVSGIAVGILPLLGWNKNQTYEEDGICTFTDVIDLEYMVYFNFFGCVLLPLMAMFSVYCYIFYIVRKQVRQISSLHQAGVTAHINAQRTMQTLETERKSNADSFAKETNAAKWFAVVILLFALCWLPIHIMNMITLFLDRTCGNCLLMAILLSHANSAINPVLYAFANSKFKTAFANIFACRRSSDFFPPSLDNHSSDG